MKIKLRAWGILFATHSLKEIRKHIRENVNKWEEIKSVFLQICICWFAPFFAKVALIFRRSLHSLQPSFFVGLVQSLPKLWWSFVAAFIRFSLLSSLPIYGTIFPWPSTSKLKLQMWKNRAKLSRISRF